MGLSPGSSTGSSGTMRSGSSAGSPRGRSGVSAGGSGGVGVVAMLGLAPLVRLRGPRLQHPFQHGSARKLQRTCAVHPPDSSQWWLQLVWLFVLAVPVACIAWTITHEEVFREPREYCQERSRTGRYLLTRKFFYLFTCEYCFSHYVTAFFLVLTRFRLLLDDWRGYLISFFAVVAIANVYMSSFGRLRQEVKSEGLEAKRKEKVLEQVEKKEQEQEQQAEPGREIPGSIGPGRPGRHDLPGRQRAAR